MTIAERPVAVVEDDKSVRSSLLRLLRSAGRSAVAYASAEEFLMSYRRDMPCCLVLDIHLRGMSGIDLVERLIHENVTMPVVFITANGDDGAIPQAFQQARITCLRKPFDESMLIQAIAAAVGEPRARRAGTE